MYVRTAVLVVHIHCWCNFETITDQSCMITSEMSPLGSIINANPQPVGGSHFYSLTKLIHPVDGSPDTLETMFNA